MSLPRLGYSLWLPSWALLISHSLFLSWIACPRGSQLLCHEAAPRRRPCGKEPSLPITMWVSAERDHPPAHSVIIWVSLEMDDFPAPPSLQVRPQPQLHHNFPEYLQPEAPPWFLNSRNWSVPFKLLRSETLCYTARDNQCNLLLFSRSLPQCHHIKVAFCDHVT